VIALHPSQFYWPFIGGAENYCRNISESLAQDHNLAVKVITTNVVGVRPLRFTEKLDEMHNGVAIERFRSISALSGVYGTPGFGGESGVPLVRLAFSYSDTALTWPYSLAFRAITSAIPHHFSDIVKEAKESDVIGIFNVITGMSSISFLAAKKAKTPTVLFPMFHFGIPTFETESLFRIARRADAAICSTTYERERIIEMGVEPKRAFVVNIGINPPSINSAGASERFRSSFDLKDDDFLACFFGRRDYDKGYPHVLKAVAELVKGGSNVTLIISGIGDRKDNLESYQYLLKNHKLIELGFADDKTKMEAISASNVLVLPSRVESFGIAFLEAFSLGKPVIGADIAPVRAVVTEGVDGFLASFGNVSEIANSIKTLLNDRNLAQSMGEAGRKKTELNFQLERNVLEIKSIYERVSRVPQG
jgi:glycosyltransferase involved in cell wall biosynthesis